MNKKVVLPDISILAAVILLLSSISALAQPGNNIQRRARTYPPVDLTNMREALAKAKSDQEKVKIYGAELVHLLNTNPDTSAALLREMKALKGVDQEYIQAYQFMKEAVITRRISPDSALYYARSAGILMHPDFDPEMYIRNSVQIASLLNQMFKPLEAQSVLIDLQAVHEKYTPDNIDLMIIIKKELGMLYSRAKATNLAVRTFSDILKLDMDDQQRCSIILSLANAYSQDQNYAKAIETLEPCVEVSAPIPQMKMVMLSSLATYHQRSGDLEEAVRYYKDALIAFENETMRMPGLNFRRLLLAETYLEAGDIDKADSLKGEIELFRDRMNPQQQIHQFVFFSELELEKNNYSKSVDYADQAIGIAERYNSENLLQDVYSVKSEALEKLGDFAGSIQALREYDSLNNRRENIAKERELSEFNIRYQLNVREDELRQASATILQLSKQMNLLVVILVLVILLTAYLIRNNRMKLALGIEKTRNQIARDLHDDLSGTLSSISFFSEAAMREKTGKEINERFMDMIGRSANEAKEKINDIIWTIDPEKDDWQDVILKCRRFASDTFDSKNIDYEIDLNAKTLSKRNIKLRQHLWLILKELTTNIARHSEADKAGISLENRNDILTLTIWDNGKGISDDQKEKGNGLRNVFRRIEDMGGSVSLDTDSGGTNWEIRFKV